MATISPTITAVGRGDGSAILAVWTPVTEADTCAPISKPELSARSVQVAGTFGGTSVAVQGSNDGINFAALNTPASAAIAIVAAGIKGILENAVQVKPVLTGGAGVSLTVSMLLTQANPIRN